jgi:SulP family sulfate permease
LAATENEEKAVLENIEQLNVPKGVEIFEIDGPFFFGLANKMDELDRQTKEDVVKVRIIRMRKVPFIDSTGINNLRSLYQRSKKAGIKVILSGVQEHVYESLEKFGLLHEIGREHVFSHIIPALAKATEMVMVSEHKE